MLVNTEELKNAMSILNGCVSQKETRPILNGIHVVYSLEDDYVTLEATDTFKLYKITLNVIKKHDFDENIDVVIKPLKLTDFKKDLTLICNFKENYIIGSYGGRVAINYIEDGHFPSFDRIIPDKASNNVAITFSVPLLKELLKGISNKNDRDVNTVTFNINPDKLMSPVIVENSNSARLSTSEIALICPIRRM